MDVMDAAGFCPCGFGVTSAAPRCRTCPHQRSATQAQVATVRPQIVVPPATAATQALMTYSRWQKSAGTFGPVGRVVATVLAFLPLPVLAMAVASGIGLIGAGIYLLVILPWALRDIWKRAAIPVQPPPGPSTPRF